MNELSATAQPAQLTEGDDSSTSFRQTLRYCVARGMAWAVRFRSLWLCARVFRDVLPGTILTRKLFGYHLSLDVSRSTAQQLLYLEGERLIEERSLVQRLLKPGMRVLDVGANIGYYLLMLERAVGPTGEVICFEPFQPNVREFKRNLRQNAFPNARLLEIAVGSEVCTTGLRDGINSGVVEQGTGVQDVAVGRLDQLVDEPVDWIKIDVDGYEGQVLEGATGLLERDRPILFLEFHPHMVGRFGHNLAKTLELLQQYYRDIEFFEVPVPAKTSFAKKVAIRYFGANAICPIDDRDSLLQASDSGNRNQTFWIVCRPT
jgi:FkbM family methyltransferase